MDEKEIIHALKCGFKAPDEQVRERLLARCLDELDSDEDQAVLDDDMLDLLAAAGNPYSIFDK